jgi:two-component system CheB/CheR fusion protein
MAMKKDKLKIPATQLTASDNQFPLVGIGASAGGLDAFKKMIKAIPENSGMAYIFVQHLDPSHESVLPDLLQRVTKIPIHEITDNIHVEPDNIYIIPSNKLLVATDGVLQLSPRPPKEQRSMPVDIFFSSLAEVHQTHAIGVVLSGTATDGTLGLKAIKDHGGITFAQDEDSAAFEGMPNSAVQAGVVDFILPPEEIPKKIADIKNKIILSDDDLQTLPQQDNDVFKQILSLLRIRRGTDFTYYKQTTIRRRILRRMAINKNEEPSAYLKYLRENKSEQDVLYQDLLIPVTSFFRDTKVFDNLCESVFPNIEKAKLPNEPVRVWVAGCSTGEEAYSMAICLKEFFGDAAHQREGPILKVQIFATDIREPAITKARSGIYTKAEVEGISPERLQEFFTKIDGSYQLNKYIRDMCVFAVHNFLKDPPFARVDFVSCRNVLIYMEPYLQKKALTAFHYALNPKGYLLLGKSETIASAPDLFGPVGKYDKLFIRKDVPGRFMHTSTQKSEQNLREPNVAPLHETIRTDFQKTSDDILLSKYTPAGVVVNEAIDIVHFRGNTADYLQQAEGKPSHNLLKMAKEGLGFELRNILHKAKTDKKPAIKENIPVLINDEQHYISIEAIPLRNTIEPHFLILFHESTAGSGFRQGKGAVAGKKTSSSKIKSDDKELRIQQLEQELLQLREDMRTITEEQEAANEELQSANEELLSGSEELQSLNEELETSKEELQSTNEELTVVNQEMISLNEMVTEARNYSEAIVANIREPLLVLDKALRVKSANDAFYKIFRVNEQETEGVYIYDLGNRQWNIPELRILLEKILPEKSKFNDFEVRHNFSAIGERIMLLNAREIITSLNSEKLILLSIEDITERVAAGRKEEENRKQLQNIFNNAPAAIALLNGPELRYVLANPIYQKLFDRTEEQLIGKTAREVFPEAEGQGIFELFEGVYQSGKPFIAHEFPATLTNEGKAKIGYYDFVAQPIKNPEGIVTNIMIHAFEVTEQIEVRKKVEASEHRYHNMIYTSPSLISIFKGEDMIIEIANDAILDSWGKGKNIIGKSIFEVMPEIIEQGFDKLLLNVYKTGEPLYAYETPVTLVRNGKPELMHYTFIYQAQRNLNGEIEGVAVIASEVTPQVLAKKKLEESEERFRSLADLMPAKISNANPDGDVTYFNKHWLDFSGYSFEELKDFGYHKMMHPDEIEEFQHRLQKAAETGTVLEMEMRFLNKYGDYKWHLNLAAPINDDEGNIKMWVGVTSEIQQQKEQREALEKAVKLRTVELQQANEHLYQKNIELQKMNKELEAFTYVSSHDLQEPLRKIQTFAGRILEKENQNLSDYGKDMFRRMREAAERMRTLIEDLLAFSRLSTAERKFEKTDLNIIIEEVKKELKEAIAAKHAVIEAGELCEVKINRSQFRQLMLNLISNALKFSKAGVPPHIIIKSELLPSYPPLGGRGACHITVSDNGIGFDKEYSEIIFEVFQKLHGKVEYAGTGIGLAIVKKIVENHNGIITATSELGKGARFDIYIPD